MNRSPGTKKMFNLLKRKEYNNPKCEKQPSSRKQDLFAYMLLL